MTLLLGLLFLVSILSLTAEHVYITKLCKSDYRINVKNNKPNLFIVVQIFILLSLFSGLRTSFNDTKTYIYNFLYNLPSNLLDLKISLADNPGFLVFQILLKQYISSDPQIFLIITALITNFLFVFFYYNHSIKFSFSIFLYITSGLFIFGMAAIKQIIAMAIGIWAFNYLLNKKWIKFFLLILLASTIHPYVLIFSLIILFRDKVWTSKTMVLIVLTIFGGLFFDKLVTLILAITEIAGEEYSIEFFTGTGVNPFRLLVYSVTPILSLIYHNKINTNKNQIITISVNMSIISFIFMILASFGTANMFARMAIYFEPFTYIALPYILNLVNKKYKTLIIILCIFCYGIYFYYQFGILKPFMYNSIFN